MHIVTIVYSEDGLIKSVPLVREALKEIGIEYRIVKELKQTILGKELVYSFAPAVNMYKVEYTLKYLKEHEVIRAFYSTIEY